MYRNRPVMTEKDQHLINELKANIRCLINSLEESKDELERIKDEYKGLEYRFNVYIEEFGALKKQYENLKVAKTLAVGDTDNQAAKQKINKLIKEVDKCIALLNQ